MNIGLQIKKMRKLKKISLTALSQDSGVQIATLSRIENGKMTGTLQSHFMIAKALGLDISELYQGMQEDDSLPVISEENIEAISAPNEKVSREILARQATNKRMLPSLIKIDGKGATNVEKFQPGSERFIWVLEGSLIAHIKDQHIKLTAHTSLYFNAAFSHHFDNPHNSTAKFISVLTPVTL
ncbi:MAG: helix-turn-helix transcriptional regulator [Candidatus Omnitrophica bacterium]|nr:helix-turn-helix transcriptional regulator [Candidatus Omnitrophota bacterium]